jgi:phosphoglycolate phosphatase-like HAD superfamily hydrolase
MWGDVNYIAFDFDGTIADSRFAICEAMERACIRRGVSYSGDDEFSQYIGLPAREVTKFISHDEISSETGEAVIQSFKETFRPNLVNMFDGMRRILELCHDMGDKISVISARGSESLQELIEQFDIKELLSAVISADMVNETQPHQEMMWEAAREMQCNPSEIIMVSSTMWDIEMAKNCGAFAVGITWGAHDEVQLRGAGADIVCDTPLALANYFNFAAV